MPQMQQGQLACIESPLARFPPRMKYASARLMKSCLARFLIRSEFDLRPSRLVSQVTRPVDVAARKQ